MVDKEVENYYEAYFDLFMQAGWKQFISDVQSASDSIQLLALQDAKELHLAQGQMQVFQRLLSWQDSITNGYDLVKEEEEQEELNA
tara:strand:- start:2048 stop:2305 length:258 start_codon:yes stop_codon:yes gene_type:complete